MITVSFDPEAGTLYWYFAEIEADSTAAEGECDGTLLLDANGDIIGLELEFDEQIGPAELALALAHPEARFDQKTTTLTINLFAEEPANLQPLHDVAIVDLDNQDRIQGCDVAAAESFGIAERLGRLTPFLIDLDADDFDQTEDWNVQSADGLDDVDPESDDELELLDELDDQPADDLDQQHVLDQDSGAKEARRVSLTRPLSGSAAAAIRPHGREEQAFDTEAPSLRMRSDHIGFRSGFVALVGAPNVGKSTLLNAFLGQKVAIVSPLPQTTRTLVRGILNRPDAQIVFVDTPGIHRARTRLGSMMVEQARRSIPDADVVCMIVDMTRPPGRTDEQVAQFVRRVRAPKLLVLNKVDMKNPQGAEYVAAYRALAEWDMELAVSALRGLGIETLLDEIITRLPQGQPMYPEDQLTDQSEREMVSELVREQVLKHTQQEVPHGVAVEVEEWEQRERVLYIRLSIYVEKESQKGILIGAAGAKLKQIGSAARWAIEDALGQKVFLDLWVKVRPNWRDDPNALHWLGYRKG